jgi:hypothetical protein
MMGIMNDVSIAPGHKLTRDDNHVSHGHRPGRCQVDVIEDFDPNTVLGDDRKALVARMRSAPLEIPRRARYRAGHNNIRRAVLIGCRLDHFVGVL